MRSVCIYTPSSIIFSPSLTHQMAPKMLNAGAQMVLVTILLCILPIARSSDNSLIPADRPGVNRWYRRNVGWLSSRKSELDPALVAAESKVTVIKVKADGSGDFKTISAAVKSIKTDNQNRVIISIGPGIYKEKVRIERFKPFITLYGDPKNVPTIIAGDTAAPHGLMESATLIIESDYFVGVNLKVVNSAPRPDGKRKLAQAAAVRITSDKSAFYNCRFHGFQDTIIDDTGRHFFKDCYIEGTVDFICGTGKSLYLNTELHVIPGDPMAMITAQARKSATEQTGFSFVHCRVTGRGRVAYLGRAWFPHARVVYAFSDIADVILPVGWFNTPNERIAYFGEYMNRGPGAVVTKRGQYVKRQLSDIEVRPFISLAFIDGSKWLLPPPARV